MTITQFAAPWRDHQPRPQTGAGEYAVLVPLVEREGKAHLLFEVRAPRMKRQPGEVCFPGGRMEEGESREACALRETWEELGIPPEKVELLARLDFLMHQSGMVLYPVLGQVDPAALESLRLNPAEVAETFLVPCEHFVTHPPQVYAYDLVPQVGDDFPYGAIGFPQGYPWRKGRVEVPIYRWGERAIWGLTGNIVRRLAQGPA